jgi:hypothetical protein
MSATSWGFVQGLENANGEAVMRIILNHPSISLK